MKKGDLFMLVLSIIGIILALIVIGWLCLEFNSYCNKKFSYYFLSKFSLSIIAISATLLLIGYKWYQYSLSEQGDTLNGMIIMGIGIFFALALIYLNIKSTNFIYGFLGTVLQFSIFLPLWYAGIIFIIIGIVLCVLMCFSTKPVYVVNRR